MLKPGNAFWGTCTEPATSQAQRGPRDPYSGMATLSRATGRSTVVCESMIGRFSVALAA
jgi:hypothetical protein